MNLTTTNQLKCEGLLGASDGEMESVNPTSNLLIFSCIAHIQTNHHVNTQSPVFLQAIAPHI